MHLVNICLILLIESNTQSSGFHSQRRSTSKVNVLMKMTGKYSFSTGFSLFTSVSNDFTKRCKYLDRPWHFNTELVIYVISFCPSVARNQNNMYYFPRLPSWVSPIVSDIFCGVIVCLCIWLFMRLNTDRTAAHGGLSVPVKYTLPQTWGIVIFPSLHWVSYI